MEEAGLSEILTAKQRTKLADLLSEVMELGHGEVTIRVQKGLPRFIKVVWERPFTP